MNNSESLVVSLRPPGSVSRAVQSNNTAATHGHPDWLGLPDVLFDKDGSIMIGMVFPVVGDCDAVRAAIPKFDESFVQLRDSSSTVARELYFGDDDEHWLEITWMSASKIGYLPAQLAEVHFGFESNNRSDQIPMTVELLDCDDVASNLGLRLL